MKKTSVEASNIYAWLIECHKTVTANKPLFDRHVQDVTDNLFM